MPFSSPVDENDLNATNKKIIELKKKIQLSGIIHSDMIDLFTIFLYASSQARNK